MKKWIIALVILIVVIVLCYYFFIYKDKKKTVSTVDTNVTTNAAGQRVARRCTEYNTQGNCSAWENVVMSNTK